MIPFQIAPNPLCFLLRVITRFYSSLVFVHSSNIILKCVIILTGNLFYNIQLCTFIS